MTIPTSEFTGGAVAPPRPHVHPPLDVRPPLIPLPPGSLGSSSSLSSTPSQWKKGKFLGNGAFGHVHQGFNSENGQMCAIKEVKIIPDDSSSKERLRQLTQEINVLSGLSHPNLVQYYGSELLDDTLSVILAYVAGGSIHKLLQEWGPFEEPVIRSYVRQILSGLAYLHERNTVHRDIKGANILVDANGEVKLADFGLAKHISAYNSKHSTQGSPYWMAPEVIMNNNGYNLSVDIWSLGCTIIEMATCKPPWSQYEPIAAMFRIGNTEDIPDIPDHLSCDAKDFLKLCLQRDPTARPTAVELMDHPFVQHHPWTKPTKFKICSETGKICAIKEVKIISDDSNSKEHLRQLMQEISLLSELSHRNIVQYYGSELVGGTLEFYLEYVSGGSIQKLLEKYGPLKESDIRFYAKLMLSGIVYLHERNIIHGDIKGANILVDPNGEVKLADFGLANHISAYNSKHLIQGSPYWMGTEVIMNNIEYDLSEEDIEMVMATGLSPWSQYEPISASSIRSFIGMFKQIPYSSIRSSLWTSPYWMAPELIMKSNGYNLPVDIWSLGCTIIEMATSKPPLSQYEPMAAIFKIMNSNYIPDIPDHLSLDAKDFLKLCLQRDPAARPTAVQLMDHPFVRDQFSV